MARQNPQQVRKKTTSTRSQSKQLPGMPAWFVDLRLQSWALFALGFLLYANTLKNDFAQDDAIVIYDNEFTQQGLAGVDEILRYDTFRGFFKVEGKEKLVAGGRYRPLSLLTFALEVELFGLNPKVGHFVNALLFGLTVVLLYRLVLMWIRPDRSVHAAYWIALGTAVLFAVHPIHTEVVANIKGRDEILALLLGMSAIYVSFWAYDRKKTWGYVLAALLFFLALLSKENAITLVALAPLAFFLFRRAKPAAMVGQALPYLASSLVFLLIRGAVLGWSLGEPSGELMNNPFLKLEGGQYVPFSSGEKLATIFYTLGKYLQLLVFPHPLTHDYYPRHIAIMTFTDWQSALSLLVYLAMAGYAAWGCWRRKLTAFGLAFYLITLSIVSNLAVVVGVNMSERFAYLPSFGFCLAAVAFLYALASKRAGGSITHFRQLRAVSGALLLVAVLFAAKTMMRNAVWKDNYTLFTTDVAVSAQSAKLQNSVGGELIQKALSTKEEPQRTKLLQEAVEHLKKALEIHPYYKNAYLLLGNAHNYLQQYEEAVQYFQQALKLDPNYGEAQNNLAITYRDAGRYYGEKMGDLRQAEKYLRLAYQEMPDDYETVRLLGIACGIQGKHQEAITFFTRAVEMAPQTAKAQALLNLGNAYYQAGDEAAGAEYHRQAQAIDPNVFENRN